MVTPRTLKFLFTWHLGLLLAPVAAQPCMQGWVFTASPPANGGTYGCGETVTFCFTVTFWNSTNSNWFHGIVANFGPGWDMSTLVPGPPPPSCSGTGTWGWYNSVQGTAGTNIGPQGPGFFYNYNIPADANPGNNFGDFCTGAVNWQFCWTITTVSGPACVNGINANVTVNTFGDSETGSWGSAACGNDPIPVLAATIAACPVNAGTGGPLALCSTAAPVGLFGVLGGAPTPGGIWTGPGGVPHPGTFDPATDPAGAYTYTVTNASPACTVQAVINVSVTQQPSAGTNGSVTVCSSDPVIALLGQLGGSPTPGGSWTGPGGQPFGGNFNPATDAQGVYTYTVNAPPPCTAVSATVNVAVNPAPNAGTNGSVSFCSTGSPADLATYLGGNPMPGGSWTAPGGGAFGGTYDPATHTSGVYTYTVTGVAPCPDATAAVTVTENAQPDAGLDATASLCSSSAAVVLTSLLGGSPDPGGTWTGPGGGQVPGTLDPATAASGNYTYTVSAAPPCVSAQATLTLTIVPQPSAGTPGAITLCETSAPTNLFGQLGGNPAPGGTWTAPGGGAFGGTYDPAIHAPGIYTYTVTAPPPCVNATATVTVNETAQPNAGSNASASLCSSGAPVGLTSLLGGSPDPGGTWTGPGGGQVPGTLDPATAASGNYTYTVSAAPPCVSAQATLTLTIVPQPSAGSPGAITLCESSPPANLFGQLGGNPAPGGTWTAPGGGAFGGTYDPAIHAPGIYTYTVTAPPPCVNATATVTVTETAQPNPGSNASASFCSSGAPVGLTSLLGGSPDPGGTWTGPGGGQVPGTLDPATAASGNYTYTVSAAPPCVSAQATLTLTIVPQPSAGSPGAITLCESSAPANLFGQLGGNPAPGGTWTAPGGGAFGGTYDPAIHAPGIYTYTVTAPPPCVNATATVTVNETAQPNAGSNASASLCSSGAPVGLTSLLGGSPDPGGTWTGPGGAQVPGTLDPGLAASGSYTYTIPAVPPCLSASAVLTINIVQPPQAGIGGQLSLCENAPVTDPSGWLGGTPDPGGTWTDPLGQVVTSVDPATAIGGNYTYTVTGTPPCPSAQAVVALTIASLPNAGPDGAITICANGVATALNNGLGAGAQPGGSWTGPNGPSSGAFDPTADTPGAYVYTVNGTGACAGNISTATVAVGLWPVPVPSFIAAPSSGCAPLTVQFINTTPGPLQSALWSFGNGFSNASVPSTSHVYGYAGEYDVTLQVTDAHGCTGTVTIADAVVVSSGPPALFSVTPLRVSTEDPTVSVTHGPTPGVEYTWTLDGQPLTGGASFALTIAPALAGTYEICLTATSALGCTNVFCVEVVVEDELTPYVPNAFTPDGDGLNDVFIPSVLGIDPERYDLIIYDRWGHIVFETREHTVGWNGGYRNEGEILPQGVYVWHLIVSDGYSRIQRDMMGTVTLLK
ncbi:MAG: gliding motility-associated C-terminal domain-containing protein [Flavobacteriales bacterium]|nr:gliding motility-associated C-terminal domain-containing protein [Flavobacteriales bacterium]